MLIQVRRALKPDGLFLAAALGGDTLHELRTSLFQAETEIEGGVSPRFSPLIDVRDLGNLMTRAGFALPVVDAETVTVSYGDPLKLLLDLRGMGETMPTKIGAATSPGEPHCSGPARSISKHLPMRLVGFRRLSKSSP